MFERTPRGWRPQEWLRWLPPGSTVLAAVSGGADSCALAVLLAETLSSCGHRLEMAHVHHGLRGSDADADAAHAQSLAATLQVPFHVRRLDAAALGWDSKAPGEAELREHRYRALREVATGCGAAVIALGHQQEDAAENFLLMALRGAGPAGLGSLRIARIESGGMTLLRPLLRCSRSELERVLAIRGIGWRLDATNEDTRYRRNALRSIVLPALRSVEAAADGLLARASMLSGDVWELVGPVASQALTRARRAEGFGVLLLDRQELQAMAPALCREVLREAWRRLAVEDYNPRSPSGVGLETIEEAISSDSGGERRIEDSSGLIAHAGPDWLVLINSWDCPSEEEAFASIGAFWNVLLERDRLLRHELGDEVEFETQIGLRMDSPLRTARFPRWAVPEPIEVRPVRGGDELLLPTAGTKSADDAMKDAKIPVVLRRQILGIYAAERLLWIPGVRRSAVDRNEM